MKLLHEVCDLIKTGKTPPTTVQEYFDGDLDWFTPGDFNGSKYLSSSTRKISQKALDDKKASLFPKDSILLNCIGDIGKVGIIKAEASSNQQITCLKPKSTLDVNYLYYWIVKNKPALENLSNSAVVPILNNKQLGSVQIPLPPLPTQKKIAAILDAADAHRQKTKQLLAKYDELAQSIFLEMFGDPVTNPKGWEKVKLGSITNMKAGKFVPASEIFSNPNDNLYECYGGNGLRGYVNSHTHKGDFVLIGRQGALCGNVKIVSGVFHATEHAIVCSPKTEYETMWLYFLLDFINLNKYATGAAQPGLNVGKLVEIEIILPPHDLQRQFVKSFNLIEVQQVQSQQGLGQSENLFNSLLQKAFKGELVK